jgi:predicted transcriptional regulator
MASVMVEEALKEGLRKGLKERFKERRGKLEIIVDILSAALEGARKTEIVYRANLNFHRAEGYIHYLEAKELIETSNSVYATTEKGKDFLNEYKMMKDLFLT